jgi:hypothetical protein
MSEAEKDALRNTTVPAPTTRIVEEDDGLSSFSLEQLGKKVGAFGGARILKFNSGVYATTAGEVISADREFFLLGLVKLVQKFVSKKLVDYFVVPPHDPIPDLKKMNAEAPQEEWGVDFNGKPQGPWTYVLVLKLRDVNTLDKYAFITKSNGGSIAFGDITEKIKWVRRLKGKNMTAVVVCEHGVRFKSTYNPQGVLRPSFRIVKHVRLADEDDSPLLLSAPETNSPPTVTVEHSSVEPSSMETRRLMTAEEKLNAFAGNNPDSEKKERRYDLLEMPAKPKPSLKDEMNDDLPI